MQNNLKFSDFLKDIFTQFDHMGFNSGMVSICDQLPLINLLNTYDYFFDRYSFSAYWEENKKISYIALDKFKYVTLKGPNKFDMAKKFNDENFMNLIEINNSVKHSSSNAKSIYFFSFSDNFKKNINSKELPNMEAVLPKILIIKDGEKVWLRINSQIDCKSALRDVIEEFWTIRKQIIEQKDHTQKIINNKLEISQFYSSFKNSNKILNKNISKGIELIKDGVLKKIVLATRLVFRVNDQFNLINVLYKLKKNQSNYCLYVWKRNSEDITFGATPEKLFSIDQNTLYLEAIAGTSASSSKDNVLLKSPKNIKEHKFVIEYLIECLKLLKITNYKKGQLKVQSFGNISHLYTLISSKITNVCPFSLLKNLHPSPAVCGLPKEEALKWIETLENFSRGNYASPIGWVDSAGNADFRVAIRGARFINKQIEFTAGSGIVEGSICKQEIDEIQLKFESLVKQIFFSKIS